MIISTYHVFGSGSAGTNKFCRPSMTAAEYASALRGLLARAVDDGHNGFVGTRSVPDEVAEAAGIRSYAWFYPGPSAPEEIEGWVPVDFLHHVEAAIDAGYGHLPVNDAVDQWRASQQPLAAT